MTVFGVIGGFAFPNGLPEVIAGVLRVSLEELFWYRTC